MHLGRFQISLINPTTFATFSEREINGSFYCIAIPGERYGITARVDKSTESALDNCLKLEFAIDDTIVHSQIITPDGLYTVYVDHLKYQDKLMNFTFAKSVSKDGEALLHISNECAGRVVMKVWKGQFSDGQASATIYPNEKCSEAQTSVYTAFVERIDASKIVYDQSVPPIATVAIYYQTTDVLDLLAGVVTAPQGGAQSQQGCCIIL